jgi:hypothetical protein
MKLVRTKPNPNLMHPHAVASSHHLTPVSTLTLSHTVTLPVGRTLAPSVHDAAHRILALSMGHTLALSQRTTVLFESMAPS